MRILHTADWHLGRALYEARLGEDQAHALGQIVRIAERERPDVVVVAGDLYDRAVPPPEAVALLDATFQQLVGELRIPVIAIAGNHDSGERLAFGSRLLARSGLHVHGRVRDGLQPIVLNDAHGPVEFFALPYADPAAAREALAADGSEEEALYALRDHDSAMRALVAAMGARRGRRVLVAHAFVAGGSESESERPLAVGGSGTVGADALEGFDYVALGHLHAPQRVGSERVRYSGSPLKYSFSEAGHVKGVAMIELGPGGELETEFRPIEPLRDVRRIEGTLKALLEEGRSADLFAGREDYLDVRVLDRGPILDVIGKLRAVYPNVLHVERPALGLAEGGACERLQGDHRSTSVRELFGAFQLEVTGEGTSEAELRELEAVLEAMDRAQREALS